VAGKFEWSRLLQTCKRSFNPHHAGEWLESAFTVSAQTVKQVSILIMLASGWKVKDQKITYSITDWFQSSSCWRVAGKELSFFS